MEEEEKEENVDGGFEERDLYLYLYLVFCCGFEKARNVC